jgi:hypothetical protein
MPTILYKAPAPSCLQLSSRALFRLFGCLFATAFGVFAITISVPVLVQLRAPSPVDVPVVMVLLAGWLATLINMYRLAFVAFRADSSPVTDLSSRQLFREPLRLVWDRSRHRNRYPAIKGQ